MGEEAANRGLPSFLLMRTVVAPSVPVFHPQGKQFCVVAWQHYRLFSMEPRPVRDRRRDPGIDHCVVGEEEVGSRAGGRKKRRGVLGLPSKIGRVGQQNSLECDPRPETRIRDSTEGGRSPFFTKDEKKISKIWSKGSDLFRSYVFPHHIETG